LKEAFAKTEEPLGWYFAGRLSSSTSDEQFAFYKKSAEGGCSWGQVGYGWLLCSGEERFGELDEEAYLQWLKKAANQNNVEALDWLGNWYLDAERTGEARTYYERAAAVGWKDAIRSLARILRTGDGCEANGAAAVFLCARGNLRWFWHILQDTNELLENKSKADFPADYHRICYALGWGMYWYMDGSDELKKQSTKYVGFASRCMNYYCSCIEMQQKSIFTFLLCWKQNVGVKDIGRIIAQMVWEGRETKLVKSFE
jgi:TPR repeat protein